jgi:hypothetical protein
VPPCQGGRRGFESLLPLSETLRFSRFEQSAQPAFSIFSPLARVFSPPISPPGASVCTSSRPLRGEKRCTTRAMLVHCSFALMAEEHVAALPERTSVYLLVNAITVSLKPQCLHVGSRSKPWPARCSSSMLGSKQRRSWFVLSQLSPSNAAWLFSRCCEFNRSLQG